MGLFDSPGLLDDPSTTASETIETGSTSPDYSAAPSYLVGSDAHNYGNGNFAITDPSTWGEIPGDVAKFTVGSVVSGLTSIYNSGVTVANWLGADAQQADTHEVLSSLDDDLGTYYQQHKTGEDLVGFLATSLIPGVGGIKVFNAGQKVLGAVEGAGMGANMARAVGLLPDAAAKFAASAASDIASSGAQIGLMQSNVLRSLAAGVGQNFLEGAAFTAAVQATMFKSPLLDQQDGWDIAKNIFTGGLVQGAIGGVFAAASGYGTIKRAVTAADQVLQPSVAINELVGKSIQASDKIAQNLQDIADIPQFASLEDFQNNWLNQFPNASDLDSQALYNRFQANAANKTAKLNNLITGSLRDIISDDPDLVQQTSHTLSSIDPVQAQGNIEQLLEAGRVSTPLKAETQILNRAAGQGFLEDISDTQAGPVAAGNKAINYVKLSGDDAGKMTDLRPLPEQMSLADTLPDADAVRSKVASYGFTQADGWSLAASTDDLDQINARYIWAKGQNLAAGQQIAADDIPLMERAYQQRMPVNLKSTDGNIEPIQTPQDILQKLQEVKNDAASDMLSQNKNTDYISRATNVARDSLEHTTSSDPTRDLFARQTAESDYTKKLVQAGLWDSSKGLYDLDTKPSWMKVAYNTKAYKDADGNVVSGMARITEMQKIAQESFNNVAARTIGDDSLYSRLIDIPKSILDKANRYGSGPGFVRFANGSYGSLASLTETIGKAVSDIQKLFKENVGTNMDGQLYQLVAKPQAALEFSSLNAEMAATTEKYILQTDGATGRPQLIARSWSRYQDALAKGKDIEAPQLQEGARVIIPIANDETADAIRAHIQVLGEHNSAMKEIHAAQGLEDSKDAETFYPLKPSPRDYPHHALVVDPTISGAGHIKMIHAPDAGTLSSLIDRVPAPFKVITKQQTEDYHNAVGDYNWDRSLHENYIDSEIQSKGINSQFFPSTDPEKIVNDIKNFHLNMADVRAREVVNMKYAVPFAELKRLGEQWNVGNASRYSATGVQDLIDSSPKNPYTGYIKTALNIQRQNEYPLWQGLNAKLDQGVSTAWNTVQDLFSSAKSPADLDKIGSTLSSYGMKTAYQDAATQLLANKSPNSGVLRSFIGKANSMLATLTLRLDPLNSINYAIGHQVLNGTEFTSVLRAIRTGNSDVAGDLANLQNVKLPQVQDFIRSPSKLIGNSIKNFIDEQGANAASGKILSDYYRENGWIKDGANPFRSLLDDLTINGSEQVPDLNSRIQSAFGKFKDLGELGAKLSGSKLSEQFQGFIAADVMRQITDMGIQGGAISQNEATAYINTFVNRVRGNMLASQRPQMFQGPIGQAIGLFQTYQFNILQQLLRHVAEGSGKDVATMLGLQGTIYGMQSLPAFNFINQHIVGTASGNPMHRDLYDATYGTLGKTAGDFLMYGLPSNMLRTNLYSRGDLNPRNMTVVPTSLSDVPIVSSYGRFFANIKQTASNIAQGGNVWESILSGLEHNAISRPLAGLAQVLQGTTDGGYAYSTTAKGNILGANDVMSISSLARLAGGRPLDEALVNDATYRVAAYQAADVQKQQELGTAMKTTLRAGESPTPDQVHQFAAEYAANGGNQKNFSKFMLNQMTNANTSAANKIANSLSSHFSQSMQQVMGGGFALDGTRIDPVSGLSYGSENPSRTGQ